jgi:hypothetical protein
VRGTSKRRIAGAALLAAWALAAEAEARVDEASARVDEFTAATIDAGDVKLGLLAFEVGVTDWLSVGTDPPAWAVRTVISVLVPNAHLKLTLLDVGPVQIGGLVGGYYADVSEAEGAEGRLLAVPVSLFTSLALGPRLLVHLEGNYNFVRGFGTGDVERVDVGGALAVRSAQLGAMLELRLGPSFSLFGRGRYQAWSTPLVLEGEGQIDPYTRAEIGAELAPERERPWMAVGGVAVRWRRLLASAGIGYGTYFVPSINVPLSYRGVVPEGSLSLLF